MTLMLHGSFAPVGLARYTNGHITLMSPKAPHLQQFVTNAAAASSPRAHTPTSSMFTAAAAAATTTSATSLSGMPLVSVPAPAAVAPPSLKLQVAPTEENKPEVCNGDTKVSEGRGKLSEIVQGTHLSPGKVNGGHMEAEVEKKAMQPNPVENPVFSA